LILHYETFGSVVLPMGEPSEGRSLENCFELVKLAFLEEGGELLFEEVLIHRMFIIFIM
jgi:hypothetical protein